VCPQNIDRTIHSLQVSAKQPNGLTFKRNIVEEGRREDEKQGAEVML